MSVEQSFNQVSQTYDQWVRIALPGFDDLFANALRVLPFPEQNPIHVLDLGAGTGLFSSFILSRYPQAHFVLVDLAEDMLAVAGKRFQANPSQFTYTVSDIRAIDFNNDLDLVISSLAIHHLEHSDKQALFQRIHRGLRPGGIFLNLDQIHAPTQALRAHYWSVWLEHVRGQQASEEQIQRSTQRRQTYDRDALLIDQLAWLKNAGFSSVDILYKNLFLGLFFAQKD